MLKYFLNLVNLFIMSPKPGLKEKFEETLKDLVIEEEKVEQTEKNILDTKNDTVKPVKKNVTDPAKKVKPAVTKSVKVAGTEKKSSKKSK